MIKCNLPDGGHVYYSLERVVSIGPNAEGALTVTFVNAKGNPVRRVITDFLVVKTGIKYD